MPHHDWLALGKVLWHMERHVQWWMGDWLLFGERKYGEKYKEALELTPYSHQTLMDFCWVAKEFGISRRRENLSWSHHKEVAGQGREQQNHLLDDAGQNDWSRQQLRAAVSQAKNHIGEAPDATTCTVSELQKLIDDGRRFGTIYADPPWPYGNQATRAATGRHYKVTSIEWLMNELPVANLAAENSHLHLWTTNAFLFEAKRVMDAWGFEYKSCFVWVKPTMGIGNYWRVSHEFLLFGLRGDAPFRDKSQMSWLKCERGRHSSKPERIRKIIERTSPGPYLELFGRRVSDGWTVWGNEIKRTMFDADVAEVA
jgi:N6-adenosine-specific RNA methylase IME4